MNASVALTIVRTYPSVQKQMGKKNDTNAASPKNKLTKAKEIVFDGPTVSPLEQEHLNELLNSGTCLAVIVSAFNAIEKLLDLAGPEDPTDARRIAPYSIRAVCGTDLVHNAVHVATNMADANACAQAVFGYSLQQTSSTGMVRNEKITSVLNSSRTARPGLSFHKSSPADTMRVGPVVFSSLLPNISANPELSTAYYTAYNAQKENSKLLDVYDEQKLQAVTQQSLVAVYQELKRKEEFMDNYLKELRERETRLIIKERELQNRQAEIPFGVHRGTIRGETPKEESQDKPEASTPSPTKRSAAKWTFQLD
ncbi:hypothetical protein AGDE_12773 [Angomonas deanei]|uniref:Nucleoside diphosphate kinase, putative n=1 Tax=Angomonas deanei TaxID=59799 RepID=A0A7G2CDH7_9TRYP|nr:hypothetical protein AGDE_12773 [Angomonas deanei]CAD2216753.1 Nucleoside diphosphate kinase, putative [Angomonas deanei]|eukprot:EPY23529.1 hypothetical protein AGDE_12773 [Angomonas deanei]